MGIKEMPRLARFIPKIMLAITVTACDEVYRKIACWLNDMGKSEAPGPIYRPTCYHGDINDHLCCVTENYRLQSAYEKNLIIKMVLVSDLSVPKYLSRNVSPCLLMPFLSLPVSVCKFISQPFLHWILPQRHGAAERGRRYRSQLRRSSGTH